jgi:hypothetical protein
MKQFNPFSQAQKWFNVFHLDRLKRIFHWMPFASIVRPDSLKWCSHSALEPKGQHWESARKYQPWQRKHDDVSGRYPASDQVE